MDEVIPLDPVHSFWYSKNRSENSISVIELMCVLSYIANGHVFHLYTYSPDDTSMENLRRNVYNFSKLDAKKIDESFFIHDAREILDISHIFLDDRGKVGIAGFSDYFRYHVLLRNGGFWVDMDTICLKPFSFQEEFVFSTQRSNSNNSPVSVTTCVIKAPKNSDFIKGLILDCDEILNQDSNIVEFVDGGDVNGNGKLKKVVWGIIGPSFLNHRLKGTSLSQYIKPPEYFCCIDYFHIEHFTKPRFYNTLFRKEGKDMFCLHVWNAMWVDLVKKTNKNEIWDKDSVIEVLKARYIKGYVNTRRMSYISWKYKTEYIHLPRLIYSFLRSSLKYLYAKL